MGKNSLIEHIKNYADPTYSINQTLLGDGHLSKTEFTWLFFIQSNLLSYEVYQKASGDTLNLKNFLNRNDEDYHDILHLCEKDVGFRLAIHNPNSPSELIEFQFFDTSGLNCTDDQDSSHAVNIISEMINAWTFNLIVIFVSYKSPFTQEQQLALEYYANVFKGLHTKILFLHMHVNYADAHHTNTIHHLNLTMKNKALTKVFQQYDSETIFDEDSYKQYLGLAIDLVCKKQPVINWLI